jgi:hypothetical protein
MRKLFVSLAPLFFCALAACQIHGIVIKETSFDPTTKIVKLSFINDRAADITAYHYSVNVQSTEPSQSGKDTTSLVDSLMSVLEWNAYIKGRPWLPKEDPSPTPGTNFIHPGQTRTIELNIGYNSTIVSGVLSVDCVVWSDNVYEGSAEEMQAIVDTRSAYIEERQFAAKTMQDTLAKALNSALVSTALAMLKIRKAEVDNYPNSSIKFARQLALISVMDDLETPKSPHLLGGQREFLIRASDRHDVFAAEASKHISLYRAGGQ